MASTFLFGKSLQISQDCTQSATPKCQSLENLRKSLSKRSSLSAAGATDCRLDNSADTGEQTFTSQILLSTLASAVKYRELDGFSTCHTYYVYPCHVNKFQKLEMLTKLHNFFGMAARQNMKVGSLRFCDPMRTSCNSVTIKATNSTHGPGDQRSVMGHGAGYMVTFDTCSPTRSYKSKAKATVTCAAHMLLHVNLDSLFMLLDS